MYFFRGSTVNSNTVTGSSVAGYNMSDKEHKLAILGHIYVPKNPANTPPFLAC